VKASYSSGNLVVITGGPGSGKTALLEFIEENHPERFLIVPEAASILFKGGFWRRPSVLGRKAIQRAIFHVQRELEGIAAEEAEGKVVLCDRGSLDGLAYWPGDENEYLTDAATTRKQELERYSMVLHLQTPSAGNGYNHANPMRTENPAEAMAIDRRILRAWQGHSNHHTVPSTGDFDEKLRLAMKILKGESR
jgi:predicted ATPase